MRKACVIGWPVAHSLSPALHSYWLKQYGIDGAYEAWEIQPEYLADAMKRLVAEGYAGCNLTLPHKELVLTMLASSSDEAKQIGAANTIIIKDGKLHGMDTDAFGFIENLRAQAKLRKEKAVVLGAGGAAKAIVKALGDEGYKTIIVCNRLQQRAQALAETFNTQTAHWDQRNAILAEADLLVNATSLGMKGKEALELDLSALPVSAVVVDIVYAPLETPLLQAAKKRGNITVDGLGMLIWQAVPAFEAWFGIRPQVTKEMYDYMKSLAA